MDFFKLAYLIEIAVVINLAYRELKYHQLSTHVRDKINEIKNKAALAEATNSTPYLILVSLIDCEIAKIVEGSADKRPIWTGANVLRIFYNNLIRSRKVLRITNTFIISCISLLILFTSFYSWPEQYEVKYFSYYAREWDHYIFFVIAITLSIMSILPLFFMYLTTKCRIYLFGQTHDPKPGKIKLLEIELDNFIQEKKISMELYNKKSANNHDTERRQYERRQHDRRQLKKYPKN